VDDGVGPLVMRVHLVRHGEAAAAPVDGDRPLTAAGRDGVARLAAWCAASGVQPAEIRHSGILRAAQTAAILAARLAPPGGTRSVRGLAPDDEAGPVAAELLHETETVLIVTHMPLVGELAALLADRRTPIPFVPAQIACFDRVGPGFRLKEIWSPSSPAA
jgi:phosphohistidine phosphatase